MFIHIFDNIFSVYLLKIETNLLLIIEYLNIKNNLKKV